MEKLFHFDSDAGMYRSDAAVVWCFDDRFTLAVRRFLKRRGITRLDSIRVAGGAKSLASPGGDPERSFVVDQLRLSRKLHGTARVILVLHSDCGAYGGLAAFGGDRRVEAENHRADLVRAAECVRSAIPEVEVDCIFVDFTGVWRVAPARAAGAG
jgi:carbonic anhydrase-like protein